VPGTVHPAAWTLWAGCAGEEVGDSGRDDWWWEECQAGQGTTVGVTYEAMLMNFCFKNSLDGCFFFWVKRDEERLGNPRDGYSPLSSG
jgi:hypothetical protein